VNIFLASLLERYTVVKSRRQLAVGAADERPGKHFMERAGRGNQTMALVL